LKIFTTIFQPNYSVKETKIHDNMIEITIISNSKQCLCPKCNTPSFKIHSTYIRKVADLPISTFKTTLYIISRKFFCTNSECDLKIFTERHTDFVQRYQRRTQRLNKQIEKIVFVLSAELASKIISQLFTPLSADTAIRIIKNTEIKINSDYTEIEIDDWAFKKGTNYGTLICDLKTRKPIDILKDRNLQTIEGWLKEHNNVKIITRDRSLTYYKAISNVIPEAKQIADKWHLLNNAFNVLKNILIRKYSSGIRIKINEAFICNTEKQENKKLTKIQQKQQERLFKKHEKIQEVKYLKSLHLSKSEISRRTGLDYKTVTKYLQIEEMPDLKTIKKSSIIDEYLDFIKEKYQDGVFASEIYKLIRKKGYTGSERTVRYHVSKLKIEIDSEGQEKER